MPRRKLSYEELVASKDYKPDDPPLSQRLVEMYAASPTLRCTARIKSKTSPERTGQRCKRQVEPGFVVCYTHGANPISYTGRPRGRPPKSGVRSVALLDPTGLNVPVIRGDLIETGLSRRAYERALRLSPNLLTLYEEFLRDPDLLNLQSEIALVRARLAKRIESVPENMGDLKDQAIMDQHLAGMAEQVARLIERQHKIETAAKNTVTVGALIAFAARFSDIVNRYVTEEDRVRVKRELAQLLGGLTANLPNPNGGSNVA